MRMITSSVSLGVSAPLRFSALLLAGLFGLLCFVPVDLSADTTSPQLDRLNDKSIEQQYQAANDYFFKLEHDTALGKDRENWLTGAQYFRKIHLTQKKDTLGPSSLFMMAKMYRRLYDHFKIPLDLENAIDHFIMVATLYPGHALADDALFGAAEGCLIAKEKEQQATSLYQKIVAGYPKSDHYDKALARIKEQKEQPIVPSIVAPAAPFASTNLTSVAPVKYWSSNDYTRIVIPTSSPVHFTSSLLEKDGDQPRKLYVDLAQSSIPPQFRNPVPIDNGLLKQIRADQFSKDTVRVILDLESLSEYKVFSLNDPFRVIIDIHGRIPPSVAELTPKALPIPQPSLESPKKELPVATILESVEKPVISLVDQKKRSPKAESQKKTVSRSHDKISLAQQLGLGVRKIVIDPGHGGKDPGAIAFDLKEKDIVLKLSKKISKILKSTYRYDVALTRTKDVYIPLEERIAIANTQNSDLFISIHINAHPDKTIGGIETYFLNLATNADAMRVAAIENATSTHNISELQDILTNLMKNSKIDESSRLAQFVQTNLVSGVEKQYKTRNLGVKQAPFYVLIGAEMPAILAEISFITNPEEAKLLQDEKYLNKIAEQIAAGIAAYVDHHHTAAVRF